MLLDGVDLRDVARGGVSAVAALVPQQTFMFDDTVRGNVTLGGDYTDEQVWAALRIAQATGFVQRAAAGLDTRVGERGATLSGGQRQRIALARAVIRRPQLLVLDDATSAVDPAVEQAILAGLREASAGTTVLVRRLPHVDHHPRRRDRLHRGRPGARPRHPQPSCEQRCAGYQRLVTAYAREAAERAAVAADEEAADGMSTSIDATSSLGHRWPRCAAGSTCRRSCAVGCGVTLGAGRGHHGRADRRPVRRPADDRPRPARQGRPRPRAGHPLRRCSRSIAVAVTALSAYAVNVRLFRASEAGLASLRIKAFRHIHDLSMLTQNTERRGSMVCRVTSDVDTISQFVQFGGIMLVLSLGQIAVATGLMLFYSPQLTRWCGSASCPCCS